MAKKQKRAMTYKEKVEKQSVKYCKSVEMKSARRRKRKNVSNK